MKQKAIFTLDQSQYPAEEFKGLLKEKNLHWVPLIDVGVSLNDHVGIDEGKKMDVFFNEPRAPNSKYVGQVWPGKFNFVDYLHPNTSDYW